MFRLLHELHCIKTTTHVIVYYIYLVKYCEHEINAIIMAAEIEKATGSETITVRINKYYLNKLREGSAEKEISLNTLMNQIVKHHIYWHSVAPKAGFISVRRELIGKVLERFTEQEVMELGRDIARAKTKDLLLLVGYNYNLIGVLEMVEAWIRASGFTYQRQLNGNKYGCALEHGMGKKWSLYLSEVVKGIFEEFNIKPHLDTTDSTLRFEIEME